jgi:hypothetical protein
MAKKTKRRSRNRLKPLEFFKFNDVKVCERWTDEGIW